MPSTAIRSVDALGPLPEVGHGPVYGHPAVFDELLARPSAAEAGGGQQLLQTHTRWPVILGPVILEPVIAPRRRQAVSLAHKSLSSLSATPANTPETPDQDFLAGYRYIAI